MFKFLAGNTFYSPHGNKKDYHLFVILNDPIEYDNSMLIVNITTERDGCDNTVILKAGDHPKITDNSYVFYERAILKDTDQIQCWFDIKFAYPDVEINPSILKKIKDGVCKSPFTSF